MRPGCGPSSLWPCPTPCNRRRSQKKKREVGRGSSPGTDRLGRGRTREAPPEPLSAIRQRHRRSVPSRSRPATAATYPGTNHPTKHPPLLRLDQQARLDDSRNRRPSSTVTTHTATVASRPPSRRLEESCTRPAGFALS